MEEIKDMVKILIPILDILYNSDLSFEDCVAALESLIESIKENEKEFNTKTHFKYLKELMENEINDYKKNLKEAK